MRFFSLAALGVFSLLQFAAAQDLSTLPTCATSCALSAIGSTGCAVTNATCICEATSFLSGVQTCISTACNATDQAATLAFAQEFCLSGGVTITLPTGSAIPPATTSSVPASSSGPASVPATVTTSTPVSPSSSPSAATFTGAANTLIQQWGIIGVLGLGVAVVL